MELMLYTTLEVRGTAVAYKIYYNLDEHKHFFKPAGLSFYLPRFQVWKKNGQYYFEGLDDKAVQEQAIADMENMFAMKAKALM